MSDTKNTDNLIENVQTSLDSSIDDIDAATQSKITQARYRALEQAVENRRASWWMPVTALASICILVIVVSLFSHTPEAQLDPVQDFEMISNIDDMELIEDMEFYEWLEEYELPT